MGGISNARVSKGLRRGSVQGPRIEIELRGRPNHKLDLKLNGPNFGSHQRMQKNAFQELSKRKEWDLYTPRVVYKPGRICVSSKGCVAHLVGQLAQTAEKSHVKKVM